MRTQTCTATFIGDRGDNQDRAVALSHKGMTLLVVADGMGGHEQGAKAAQAAIDSLDSSFKAFDGDTDPASFLKDAIQSAHRAVFDLGRNMDIEERPRTTCVAAILVPPKLLIAHVGDSRAYVLRDRAVLYRTRDHSHVEELIAAGRLAEKDRNEHPLRNLVERCCGGESDAINVEVSEPITLKPGDLVLLCSDGFWEPLDFAVVAELLADAEDPQSILEEVAIEACALNAPMADNATAAVLRVDKQ